jgi:hypothetical protein
VDGAGTGTVSGRNASLDSLPMIRRIGWNFGHGIQEEAEKSADTRDQEEIS